MFEFQILLVIPLNLRNFSISESVKVHSKVKMPNVLINNEILINLLSGKGAFNDHPNTVCEINDKAFLDPSNLKKGKGLILFREDLHTMIVL